MILVPQQQLQRMRAGTQGELGLGLASAEMQVIEIVGDRLVERRQADIDQKVMMPGIRFVDPSGRDAHLAQAELDQKLGWDCLAVLEINEIRLGPRRRGRGAALLGDVLGGGTTGRRTQDQQTNNGIDEARQPAGPASDTHARSPNSTLRIRLTR